MKKPLAIVVALAVTGCSGHIEKDDRPAFAIDLSQPFHLEFGRGSGRFGLNTVKIDQTGRVVIHRKKVDHKPEVIITTWETATIQLSPASLAEVIKAVESSGLTALHKAYHKDIDDGAQWVLWIKQGTQEKSVYFNNSFPWSITTFAYQLDMILAHAGIDNTTWQTVPEKESGQHARELWNSIKR